VDGKTKASGEFMSFLAEIFAAFRAILFTDNPAAERSYAALGFRRVGDYAVLIVKSNS
jgi:hypothetical protein